MTIFSKISIFDAVAFVAVAAALRARPKTSEKHKGVDHRRPRTRNSYVSGSNAKRISVWPARFVANERLPIAAFRLWPGFRPDT